MVDGTRRLKVHAAIAQALIDNSVELVFGVMGDANLFIVNSFVREHQGRYVAAAHESGAVLMAMGYAMVSHRVGVATVTHGPALSNTVTALIEATTAQIPLVIIAGDTPVAQRDHLQNIPQRELIIATGAGFEQLRAPNTVAEDVARAFHRAWIERRPIVLNVPTEFNWLETDYHPMVLRFPDTRMLGLDGEDIENAVGIIAASRSPLILAGRGAISPSSKAALIRLANRIGAPLATTLKAKDLFFGEPFNLGICGTLSHPVAIEVIAKADCIIAFGASLSLFTGANGSVYTGKRIIQCNAEPGEIAKTRPVDAGLVGDPGLVADRLVHWLDEAEIPDSGFATEDLAESLRNYSPSSHIKNKCPFGTIDIDYALLRLNDGLPVARTLVTDGGRFVGLPWKYMRVEDPRDFVFTVNIGSIGLGLAAGIGAAFAAPDRPVVLITGDGGFMLGGLTEFNTAVRHKVDLIVIICNDGAYGAEHVQFTSRSMDPALTLFDWPDFAPIAEALGGHGWTVRSMDDLDAAIAHITNRERSRPLLIDLKLDPEHMPEVPI